MPLVQSSKIDMSNPFNNGNVSANAPKSSDYYGGAYKNAPAIKQPAYSPYGNKSNPYGNQSIGNVANSKTNPSNPYGIQPFNSGLYGQVKKSTESTPVKTNTSENQSNTGSQTGSQNNPPVVTPPVPPVKTTDTPLLTAVTGQQTIANGNGLGNPGAYQTWLQNQATSATPAQGAISTLNNIAQNGSPQVQQQNQNVQGLLNVQNEIANNPNLAAEVASGRGQAIGGEINAAQQGVQNALAQQNQQITAGNEAGNLGLTGQSQQLGAENNAANLGLTQQGQQILAGSSAGQLSQPVTGPGGVLGTPQSVQPFTSSGAGSNSGVGGGIAQGNVQSASTLTQGINEDTTNKNSLDATFNYLNSTTQGFDANTPILTQLQQKAASTIGGPQALAQYQQTIDALTKLGAQYGINIPANPTPSQIQGLQQSISAAIQNKIASQQQQLQIMTNGGSSSNSSSGSSAGGSWESWANK